MTLISFVIPPTPGTPETAANAASLWTACHFALQREPSGIDLDVHPVGGRVVGRHQRLERDAADRVVIPMVPRVNRELILHAPHPANRLRHLNRFLALVPATDAPSQRHVTLALGDRDHRRMGDVVVFSSSARISSMILMFVMGRARPAGRFPGRLVNARTDRFTRSREPSSCTLDDRNATQGLQARQLATPSRSLSVGPPPVERWLTIGSRELNARPPWAGVEAQPRNSPGTTGRSATCCGALSPRGGVRSGERCSTTSAWSSILPS